MNRTILFALTLLLATPASAEPWSAQGQDYIPGNLDSAETQLGNLTGALIGEATLPYTVPQGKTLILKCWGIEMYGSASGNVVIFPYFGWGTTPEYRMDNGGLSVTATAGSGTNFKCGMNLHVRSGETVQFRLLRSGTAPNRVYGWAASGELVDE